MKVSFTKANSNAAATPPTVGTAPVATPTPAAAPAIAAPATPAVTAPVETQPEPKLVQAVVIGNDGQTQALARSAASSVPQAYYDGDEAEGFRGADLVVPTLNIVQKVGDLSNVFPPGTLVFGSQLVLQDAGEAMQPSQPIRLVILGLQPTSFVEKLDGGARGNVFHNEAEVVQAGGTLDWNEHKATKKPLYQYCTKALIVVQQVEGLDPTSFPYEIEGKNYAFATYSMKGIAYTNAARHFKSARKVGHLRDIPEKGIKHSYRDAFWTLSSQLRKYGANYAYAPVVKAAEPTSEQFRRVVSQALPA